MIYSDIRRQREAEGKYKRKQTAYKNCPLKPFFIEKE